MPRTFDEQLRLAFAEGTRGIRSILKPPPPPEAGRVHLFLHLLRNSIHEHRITPEELYAQWDLLLTLDPSPISIVAFLSLMRFQRGWSRDPARLSSLLASAREILADEDDPDLQVMPDVLTALSNLDGGLARSLGQLQTVLSRVPRASGLRHDIVMDVGLRCALHGIHRDLGPLAQSGNEIEESPLVLFLDAAERGDIEQAQRLAEPALKRSEIFPENRPMLVSYQHWVAVMAAVRVGGRPVLPPLGDGHALMHRDLAMIVRLLDGDPPELDDALHMKLKTASLHLALLPVHIALARRETHIARLYLVQRESYSVKTPSSELAWAILHHLEGDTALAYERLESALSAADHYGSLGRLDFDLRLVPGLSLTALLRLVPSRPKRFLPTTTLPLAVAAVDRPGSAVMLGDSEAMHEVRADIRRAAASDDVPALILGETGTGKELAARAIHFQGPRAKLPFIAVNCAAVADDLLLAELFGHAKGAFTGSTGERGGLIVEAGRGTIFLDEIGDASPRFQASLLRLIESGEYRRLGDDRIRKADCRIISATNVDLDEAVAAGRFRSDLRYRLERLLLRLPPLRDRVEDIPLLVHHFLGGVEVADDLVRYLAGMAWPGNIRELRNACERVALRGSLGRRIDLAAWSAYNQERRRESGRLQIVGRPVPETTRVEYPPTPALDPRAIEVEEPVSVTPLHGDERLQAMRELFRRRGRMTRVEVMKELSCAGSTATMDLKTLCDEGLIEKVEPSRAPRTHYFRLRRPAG